MGDESGSEIDAISFLVSIYIHRDLTVKMTFSFPHTNGFIILIIRECGSYGAKATNYITPREIASTKASALSVGLTKSRFPILEAVRCASYTHSPADENSQIVYFIMNQRSAENRASKK